ncbi:MAG TPA: amidohydrolase family protein [Rectinemataceae bacterium]|nr:amidohydrolase family protein [Rectinemataceae bacterium]
MILRNGLLALTGRDEPIRSDIRIEGARIVAIAKDIPPDGGPEVDLAGLMVFPAAIDPHVHFDDPGFTHREDFLHGTMEAAKGGVGTIIDMPCTSLPPVTTKAALDNKLGFVRGKAIVDYAFFGGVSGHTAAESLSVGMSDLAPFVVGYKCYFVSGMDSFTAVDHDQFPLLIAEASRLGRPLLLHAEDPGCITGASRRLAAEREAGGRAPEWRDWSGERSRDAELVAAVSAIALARDKAATLHIVHVGNAEVVAEVARSGASCETCAHYLAFSEEDFPRLGAALKTAPPVKTAADREGLWQALAEGKIAFLTSDHAPAPASEKNTGNPLTAYGGIPGVGTGFPFLLSEGYFGGRLGLGRFLDATSGAAARRYGLAMRKGSIAIGKDADFAIVDPSSTTTIEGERLLSLGRITPFEGMRLTGRVVETWVRGTPVFSEGGPSASIGGAGIDKSGAMQSSTTILASPGFGKFLTWGYR